MQGFMILAIIGTEKYTQVFYLSEIMTKSMEREKSRSRAWANSACL